MTFLRMGDGPVANLPDGLDAVAGYVNQSGIGETYCEVCARFPSARHLSITTNGSVAECADVETGAMTSWTGYTVGYCSISNAENLINTYGRPRKLWTAHYTAVPHICSPACGFGFTGTADGTQWTDHGGAWDESLIRDDFFDFQPDPYKELDMASMVVANNPQGQLIVVGNAKDNGNLLVFTETAPGSWSVADVTDAIGSGPGKADPRVYQID